eukprot:TRINITY_DN61519_c0_g1_i1.p1 TRINITY_DN61519_c0_g1~~TRINITY_DN61519_c0_g1_i1.p1  ORF type:complete len:531 (-),score=91.61 TRINITY_DN61519_c0_g1_i1:47-1639(-)
MAAIAAVLVLLSSLAKAEFSSGQVELAADDACDSNATLADDSESCALSVLQTKAAKPLAIASPQAAETAPAVQKLGMMKLPRLKSHREPHVGYSSLPRLKSNREPHVGYSSLTGAAWADFAVEVTVGGQKLRVIVDTGSSNFAVAAGNLAGCAVFYHGLCDGFPVATRYGSANWTGRVCRDVEVSIAGLSAGKPSFAGILEQQNFLTECSSTNGIYSTGIVGMAYQSLLGQRSNQRPLLDSVVDSTGIRNVFALQCCPWSGQGAGSGSLTLGGWDEALYREEDFKFTPITMEKWFCVGLLSIFVDGFEGNVQLGNAYDKREHTSCSNETVGSCVLVDCQAPATCDLESLTCRCPVGYCSKQGRCVAAQLLQAGDKEQKWGGVWDWVTQQRRRRSQKCSSIIDSGTSALVLREDVHKGIIASLDKAARRLGVLSNCITEQQTQAFPDIVLRLGAVEPGNVIELRVPASKYFQRQPQGSPCMALYLSSSGTLNSGLGNIPLFILGQPLMETFYTVFDKEKGRIGFAPMRGCW